MVAKAQKRGLIRRFLDRRGRVADNQRNLDHVQLQMRVSSFSKGRIESLRPKTPDHPANDIYDRHIAERDSEIAALQKREAQILRNLKRLKGKKL